jgi:hypothetical protein
MFEPMDLSDVSEPDLAVLLQGMRALAMTKNKPALDLFCIVEREFLARHPSTEIGNYSDTDLHNAAAALCVAIDEGRKRGLSDDYPTLRFMLLAVTAFAGELERRGTGYQLQ